MEDPIEVIRKRFGIHRGLESPYAPPNSLQAIKSAVDLNPVFVEFDVIYHNGKAKTAHPPQEPLDDLEKVIDVFRNTTTFPKIDLKFRENTYKELTRIVLDILRGFGKYTLVNLSGIKDPDKIMKIEEYFAEQIRDMPYVKINIDLARYRKPGRLIDEKIAAHLEKIKDYVDGISLEIHEENWDYIAKIATEYGIRNYYFWLRGWPDIRHPVIHIETIYKAIELEKRYNIRVYFDINVNYIQDLNKIIILYDKERKKKEVLPFLFFG